MNVGKPVSHESARGHVTGEALFTDDLCNRFPNLLHAWPIMVPHAHARIVAVDFSAVVSSPGVCTVLTANDALGEANSGPNRHDEPLFPIEVFHYNQPIAWVLAASLEAARLAATKAVIEYEKLPAILSIEDAIDAQSYLSGPALVKEGDPAGAIDGSEHRLTGQLAIGGQEHFYLETQCAIAWIDPQGAVSLHSSTQHPSETQAIVARVLGIAEHQVTVECLRMGGAFGGKEVQANPYAAIAALGAWKTRQPVRVRLPRSLDVILTGKRHPFFARFTVGYTAEGKLNGLDVELYSDGGWSLDLSEPILWRAIFHLDNAYRLPTLSVSAYVCRTNKTSQTAFRGFGGPQGIVVIEDVLDRIARSLYLPVELVRERNMYCEGDITHYGMPVKDASRIERIWMELKTSSDFATRRGYVAEFNADHLHRKRGIAITPVKFGISFTATMFNQAGALVLIYRDGSVQVNHGGTEMGQGLHTKILQIAADSLGVRADTIRVMSTRTDKVPNTSATAASASTDLNGAAVVNACQQLQSRLAEVAASMLASAPETIHFADGRVFADGRSLPFAEVVEATYRERISLSAQGYYRTPGLQYNPKTGRGIPFHYFAYGAAVAEVEIDGFTGAYRVLRADILQDVGNSTSPLIDRGQVEGGFLQGVGWLTLEELIWNADGRLATDSASTYKLPSWSEVPEDFRVSFLTRASEPGVVFGSKAVGEPPLMLAISVREAIRAGIAAFGHSTLVTLDSPATPERVYWAIQRVRG